MLEESGRIIKDMTLEELRTRVCDHFKIKRAAFDEAVFGITEDGNVSRTFKRIKEGKALLRKDQCYKIAALIEELSTRNRKAFDQAMREMYPELSGMTDKEKLKETIWENLQRPQPDPCIAAAGLPDTDWCNLTYGDFVEACCSLPPQITRFRIAAHSGWSWLHRYADTLMRLSESGVIIQFIGNPSSEIMTAITKTLNDAKYEFIRDGLNESLHHWNRFSQKYGNVDMRISNLPILHQTLIADFADGTARAQIRDYTYGSEMTWTSPNRVITQEDAAYRFYDREFAYLWENGMTYAEWMQA